MLLRNALTTMPRLDEDEDDVENENYSVSGNLMSTWEGRTTPPPTYEIQ